MSELSHEGKLDVRNVNMRVENHGDDSVLAFDVSVAKTINDEELCDLLDTRIAMDMDHVRELKLENDYSGYIVEFHIQDAMRFTDARICKFVIEPKGGDMFELRCHLQVRPSLDQTKWFAAMLIDGSAKVKIEGPSQGDLIDASDEGGLAESRAAS